MSVRLAFLYIFRKFGRDNMQQRTIKAKFISSTSLKTFNIGKVFNSCNVFVFDKNLLCRLRGSCLLHNVNNGVKCK